MLLDNKTQGKVGEARRQSIQKDARLSFISSFFSVYGFSVLRQELGRARAMRLLVPASSYGTATPAGRPFRIPGLAGIDAGRRQIAEDQAAGKMSKRSLAKSDFLKRPALNLAVYGLEVHILHHYGAYRIP